MTSQASRMSGPNLTPSLAKYFRADLITHVTNWASEILEKQVIYYSKDIELLIQETKILLCFRHKNALRMFICWVIWNAVKFQQKLNVRGVL